MSVFEVRSRITHRSLMRRSKYELARQVLDALDEADRLRAALAEAEREIDCLRAREAEWRALMSPLWDYVDDLEGAPLGEIKTLWLIDDHKRLRTALAEAERERDDAKMKRRVFEEKLNEALHSSSESTRLRVEAEQERERLRSGVVRLVSEWESFRWGHMRSPDADAGTYAVRAVHDCADELRKLIDPPSPPEPVGAPEEERPTVYWAIDDPEVLTHTDPDEAIEAYLDNLHPDPIPDEQVTVYGYRRMVATAASGWYLETLLENLDEEYGSGDTTEPTDAMREAEQAFIDAVLAEYEPWACEPSGDTVTVNARAWAREHRPDWLEKEDAS